MGNFTKEDEGRLFTLLIDPNSRLGEESYYFLLKGTFGSEKETQLHTSPNDLAKECNPKETSPLLYLGKRKVTIGQMIPGNATVKDFHVFLSKEKFYGVPDHMYHSSSEPLVFALYGTEWSEPTIRYRDQDLRYEGHLYVRPVLVAKKVIESIKVEKKPITRTPKRMSFWDRLLLAVVRKLLS